MAMNPRPRPTRLRFSTIAALTLFALFGVTARDAAASCFARPLAGRLTAPKARIGAAPLLDLSQAGGSQGGGPISGLWRTVFTATSPFEGVYDEGFQQFHEDGTELMISRGVPPDLGNVCIGVWKRDAGGVIKLRHTTWNWTGQSVFSDDPDQAFANAFSNMPTGHVLLNVTLRTNSAGTTFSGTWTAAGYDDDGNLIDGSEAEGTVEAERIAAD
jgi:hypothetical protein